MEHDQPSGLSPRAGRIAWLDCAKGICIIFVVMLYATELVAHTAGGSGWLEAAEAFVRPFRMPDFFLLSGLLLARVIGRDWRTYLDRKVLHFAYFYALWLTILFVFEAPRAMPREGWTALAREYLEAYVRPYSMLWFIYMLAIFFVVTKALRKAPPALVWTCAAALQVAHADSGIKVLDKLSAYYVYFHTGFVVAPLLVRFATLVSARRQRAWAGLLLWALLNGYAVFSGHAAAPLASLALALSGAVAVVALSALVCHLQLSRPFAYCGAHSIVIYLAFYIPLQVTRKIANELIRDPGLLALACTLGGVLGALALYRLVRATRFRFLFERPGRFSLRGTGWRSRSIRYAG